MSMQPAKRQLFLQPLLFLLLLSVLALCPATTAGAASKPVKITSCKLTSASKIRISASLSDKAAVEGRRCYLFALPLSQTKLKEENTPVKSVTKAKKMNFSLQVNNGSSKSRLYTRFVIAEKQEDGYRIISNAAYVTNPSKAAKYTYRFPTATSKKGLQVCAEMLEDAAELNVRHSVLNIVFTELISSSSERNRSVSIPFSYHGKTWWFRKSVVEQYDRQLISLKQSGTVVSAVLLLGWRNDLTGLIYPSGREAGHAFYAWNASSSSAREQLQAALSFLARRYTDSSAKYGRISNWIVGNEVNNYKVYYYSGNKTLSQHARIYANAFRMAYNTITSVYSRARVYISLDHLWNTNWVSGTFASRKMLDAIVDELEKCGAISWHLAFHPYNSPLTDPCFWNNTNGQIREDLDSPAINMANIGVLTSYIRETYGSNHRIILSEQGYTSLQKGTAVEKEQSAAIAYSYYLAEADDMIDSFIMNRHVDHQTEIDQGLNLGLWTTAGGAHPEWANTQKDSWEVFKYMDTNQSVRVTQEALTQIGADSWEALIPDFSPELYTHTSLATAPASIIGDYTPTAPITGKWKAYGAASSVSGTEDGAYRARRNSSRNRNALWGFTKSFSNRLSFADDASFCVTVKAGGSTSGQALVRLRLYSTKTKILESSCLIPVNQEVRLLIPAANWAFRDSVAKIQVTLAPAGGSWTGSAYFDIKNPAICRMAG